MLRDSMRGAKERVANADATLQEREQNLNNQRQNAIINVKHHLDWIVYSCYKQICDAVADSCVRNASSNAVSGCVLPTVPAPLFVEYGSRIRDVMDEKGFTTSISLSEAQSILDKKETGIGSVYDDGSEVSRDGIVLSGSRTERGGFGILGYTDTHTYTLTHAGILVVNEIERLGKEEGISITSGVLFRYRAWRKTNRAGEESFVPFKRNQATCKCSSDYGMDQLLAFQYSY